MTGDRPRAVLVSTYELGRQPFGLASPAAWLERAGVDVTCLDLSREPLRTEGAGVDLVAFHLPMHTATRLALPVIRRIRRLHPDAALCCYGLYAPPNATVLRSLGVRHILGGEFEADLVALALAERRPGAAGHAPSERASGAGPGTASGGGSGTTSARSAAGSGAPAEAPPGAPSAARGRGAASNVRSKRASGAGSGTASARSAVRSGAPAGAAPGALSAGAAPGAPPPAASAGTRPASAARPAAAGRPPHLAFVKPARGGLPPLRRYAALHHGGARRIAGYTEASRGCRHLCRHCPVVPVYRGQLRVVPADVVVADVEAQVRAGAQHVTFGDPDFFNAVGHALRVVEGVARACPGTTYDVTIKVEHLLRHAAALPRLRETGCLLITSAVESFDDRILARFEKGHTGRDAERAVALCRAAGIALAPTFVPFTPWTTREGYRALLSNVARLGLVDHVAPIQFAIRLLVPAGSRLLEPAAPAGPAGARSPSGASASGASAPAGALSGASPPGDVLQAYLEPYDPVGLVHPWRHPDPEMDHLAARVGRLVAQRPRAGRREVFGEIWALAHADRPGGAPPPPTGPRRRRAEVPYLDEPWYC